MKDPVLQMYRESNRKQNGVFKRVILENPNFLFSSSLIFQNVGDIDISIVL
jgi:hypothetical protein